MDRTIELNGRRIGSGQPVYVVAEVSCNHDQKFEHALRIIEAAKQAGADAVKLQTYTPDTITMRSRGKYFQIGGGTLWDGQTLYDLYQKAYTPWEWHPKLKAYAEKRGVDFFSSAFDPTAVNFLEELGVVAHKVASFELVDLALIEKMAGTGKPLIISTGMASIQEIEEAVQTALRAGAKQIALLKCTSAYPALPDEMNLKNIPDMAKIFQVPVGLSDHSKGITVAAAAIALGACIVEKHIMLSRSIATADARFSLEPEEFKAMVEAIRTVEQALGKVAYGTAKEEAKSRVFRRSLFVVQDVKARESFTLRNVRSIRPAHGLHTRFLNDFIGKKAAQDIEAGTPLNWSHVEGGDVMKGNDTARKENVNAG